MTSNGGKRTGQILPLIKGLFQNLSSVIKDILVKLTEKQCIPLQYDQVNSLFIKHVGNSFLFGFWDFEISLALTWWLNYC